MSGKLAAAWLLILAAGVVLGPSAFGLDPEAVSASEVLLAPSGSHWLGTDRLGRDVALRVWAGARVSVGVALGAAILASWFGGLLGILAGGLGGRVDRVITHVTEAILAVPKLPLLLLVASVDVYAWLPGFSAESLSAVRLNLVLATFGWTSTARVVRASAARIRSEAFVTASRGLGGSTSHQLRRHIVPHAAVSWAAISALELGDFLIYESLLSFLGLGVLPPLASWGTILAEALTDIHEAPWLFVAPGVLTLFTIASLHILVDRWTRRQSV